MDLESWTDLMESHFPMTTADGYARVEFIGEGTQVDDDGVRATIRLVAFEDRDGQKMLRDVKEQQVSMGGVRVIGDLTRYGAFLEALRTLIGEMFSESLRPAMPYELYPSEVFELEASTFDEFGRALSVNSRLGEFLE